MNRGIYDFDVITGPSQPRPAPKPDAPKPDVSKAQPATSHREGK